MTKRSLTVAMLLLHCCCATAQVGSNIDYSWSGFLTTTAGKLFGGDAPQNFNGYRAPIFVVDYGQGGVYERGGWSLKPDTKLGLQGTATFSPQFSATAQIVSRGTRNGKVNLEWAYANYAIDDRFTLQFGRKRLPLFYYSETQDVGLTYPWTHLPPGQYGWEMVNYNGANLLYRDQWGHWSSSMNFFAGGDTRKDDPYQKIYNGRDTRTDSRWRDVRGIDLTLTRNWFEVRTAYIESKIQDRFEDPALAPPYDYSPLVRQSIYALSFAVDHRNWVVRNEYLYMTRKQVGEQDYSFLLGIGYRLGKLLPMITYNRYKMHLDPASADASVIDPTTIDPQSAEGWSTLSLSLRYDLTPTSALKVQLERWRDMNGPTFNADASGNGVPFGNARLLTIGYDMVF